MMGGDVANIEARWRHGVLEYFDTRTNEVVDVIAPLKINDDFKGVAVDTTNDWTVAGVNSGAASINAATGGHGRLTTGSADDDDIDLASELIFKPEKICIAEARIAMNDVDGSAFNFGFSDAKGEAADKIAVTYATATLTSNASDFAGFFWDPDATSNFLGAVAVKGDTDGTVIDCETALEDAAFHTYRVEIYANGDVDFWVDGEYVGSQSTGITTTTALCVYLALINREAAANTLDVDYIRAWQATR